MIERFSKKKKKTYNNIHFEVSCRLRIERYPLSKKKKKNWENFFNQGKLLCISFILNGFLNFQRVNLEDIISSTFWKEENLPKSEKVKNKFYKMFESVFPKNSPLNTILKKQNSRTTKKPKFLSQLSMSQDEW